MPVVLATERLELVTWEERHRAPFATMNADPEVMRFFPSAMTRAESDDLVDRFVTEQAERGWCPWAVKLAPSGEFLGFTGLHDAPEVMPFAPAVEIGWRLGRRFWGRGYATEAATAALAHAFGELALDEVVSFTAAVNGPSRRLMERLGMTRDAAEDFAHPRLAEGDALRPHVLYRIPRRRS